MTGLCSMSAYHFQKSVLSRKISEAGIRETRSEGHNCKSHLVAPEAKRREINRTIDKHLIASEQITVTSAQRLSNCEEHANLPTPRSSTLWKLHYTEVDSMQNVFAGLELPTILYLEWKCIKAKRTPRATKD